MKRSFKIIGIVVLSIIGIYTLFIVEESIRLSRNVDARPLIINNIESVCDGCVNSSVVFHSLGFKLVNNIWSSQVEDEDIESTIVGQEFWLFDTFLLWGWIN